MSSYQTELGKALSNRTDTVKSVRPNKTSTAKGWSHRDNPRNELNREVKQIKRCVDRLYLGLCFGVGMLVLMLCVQLLLWLSQ